MENTTISITLHILLNPQILSSQQTNENGIDMSLRINSNTLITNISHTIMSEIGLQQLTSYHEGKFSTQFNYIYNIYSLYSSTTS